MSGNPKYRNRANIRNGNFTGAHLQEALDDLVSMIQNVAKQVNANPHGSVEPPPQVSSVSAVTNNNGVVSLAIHDDNPIQRGLIYHIEMSTTQNFDRPLLVHTGPSRTPAPIFVGNQTVYFRAFSQYPTSDPSAPIYSTPVQGGGTLPAVALAPSTGSGTADSTGTQGGVGFGNVDFREGNSPRLPR